MEIHVVRRPVFLLLVLAVGIQLCAQTPLINNLPARQLVSLDGNWQYIIDPYETGFYDYRLKERRENDPDAYWNTDVPANKTDKKEHGYTSRYSLRVPGDWNSQSDRFLYYEGTVWYKRSFDFSAKHRASRIFLYFGAVNYRADIYLNGHKLGTHEGGFTPFNFELPDSLLHARNNFLVVKVDNKRHADDVPTVNTDWWNYGGITRSVYLVELPKGFIKDYSLSLNRQDRDLSTGKIEGAISCRVALDGMPPSADVTVTMPELNLRQQLQRSGDTAVGTIKANGLETWSPEHPRRYRVVLSCGGDTVTEKIGFRTVEVQGRQLLLNGHPIFLRGISIHEENPMEKRRAYSRKDAEQLLGWAQQLGCNMVRLAHYPHNENMTRVADSLGILVWSEIPVYWTIDFTSNEVYNKALKQLHEMIARDHNRSSIIIWSVGNETPVSESRTRFMSGLISAARALDPTRLVSAALEVNYNSGKNRNVIDDPLGQYTDIVSFNEYLGWYGGLPSNCRTVNWETPYNKPLFISETGAEALSGFHADSLTRWSEEYQEWYYREQIAMLARMPDNFVGTSPWILCDFRSPRRNNPVYQDGWNNKGLIDQKGRKKKAFYLLQAYYRRMQKTFPY